MIVILKISVNSCVSNVLIVVNNITLNFENIPSQFSVENSFLGTLGLQNYKDLYTLL